jgi:hypothetical protein
VVARKDEDVRRLPLFNVVAILRDGVGRAAVPAGVASGLVGLEDGDAAAAAVEIPGPTRANVIVQRDGCPSGSSCSARNQ